MALYTSILTGGSNNHETTSEHANSVATDFVSEGVVGAITNTTGVAPMTGAFAVNAQGTPDMTTAVSAGRAYVTATPSGQASQTLSVYNNATVNVTHAANSSGSTKYDWIYISISAANAANPNTAGDNVASIVVSRSSSASSDDGTPPTYGYAIAVVTVANGASSLANGTIADVRERAATVGGLNDDNGNEVVKAVTTASAVNEVTVTNAATGNAPIIEATGNDTNIHLVARGKGNGLTKVSVLRQDNTTNTYKHNSVILTGWGFENNTGTQVFTPSEVVTFGITFAQSPIVVTSSSGYRDGSDPAGLSNLSVWESINYTGTAIGTTGFTVRGIDVGGGTLANGRRTGYCWIAIGELA